MSSEKVYDRVMRPVSALVGYDRNARTHSPEQVGQIASAIREFGFTNPILIDERDNILAGHGRQLAAQKLGMTEVPCILVEGLSKTQKRALTLADNKIALNSGWNPELLSFELQELLEFNYDVSVTGFSEDEIRALTAQPNEGLTDPDDVPAEPQNPASVLGDVWLLGSHRLVAGDCTDPLVVDKALNGVKPHLMVTDPPYGVEYDPAWRGDTTRTGKVLNDDRADWRDAYSLFPGSVAYVWHASLFAHVFAESLIAADFDLRAQIIWAKPRLQLSRGHYHWQHEPCWYAVRKGANGAWNGDRKQTTLWQIDHKEDQQKTKHGTQKPVECMKRPIENNSSPGHAIYEPFSGSGTTIIAGEMTGRSVHAIELNPQYIDVAVLRWQAFIGKDAILEATGQTFGEVSTERLKQEPQEAARTDA